MDLSQLDWNSVPTVVLVVGIIVYGIIKVVDVLMKNRSNGDKMPDNIKDVKVIAEGIVEALSKITNALDKIIEKLNSIENKIDINKIVLDDIKQYQSIRKS
jgi:hypothetical protein